MARLCALESSSLSCLRNCVRHSVTATVKPMYTSSAISVMPANQASNLTPSKVSTITISISVGRML